jgi:xylan 1,4-beta-xylosidase
MRLSHYRIDEHHSNAYTLWQSMGSVQNPTSEQYAALQEASQLALFEPVRRVDISDGEFSVQLGLPRHAVSLVRLEW